MKEERVQTAVRVAKSFLERFERVRHQRLINSQNEAIEQAMQAWMERPPQYLPQNRELHDLFEEIVNDPEECVGIEKNVHWAIDSMRARRGKADFRAMDEKEREFQRLATGLRTLMERGGHTPEEREAIEVIKNNLDVARKTAIKKKLS